MGACNVHWMRAALRIFSGDEDPACPVSIWVKGLRHALNEGSYAQDRANQKKPVVINGHGYKCHYHSEVCLGCMR